MLGWNKVFSYLKNEFFTIRNCRSFVGGHFSNRTPSFLLVPLRIWLGVIWLYEGIMKVVDGWISTPKLTEFFTGANEWYNSILKNETADAISYATTTAANAVTSATGAVEATTSATGAGQDVAEALGTVIFNFDFLGLFQAIFVSGKDLIQSTINDYAFKINLPLVNWFVDNLILQSDSMQIIMQSLIVIAEILIGLALIGDLFTTLLPQPLWYFKQCL